MGNPAFNFNYVKMFCLRNYHLYCIFFNVWCWLSSKIGFFFLAKLDFKPAKKLSFEEGTLKNKYLFKFGRKKFPFTAFYVINLNLGLQFCPFTILNIQFSEL